MKTLFLNTNDVYDGTQLRHLFNYLRHDLLGTSVVSWIGPCDVHSDHIMDGEDLRNRSKICADKMLHFIFEIYGVDLYAGVGFQRIFTSLMKEIAEEMARVRFIRVGDDLFADQKKFNISIAAPSLNSVLIHTGVNVLSSGAPVAICSLEDFQIPPEEFAKMALLRAEREWKDIEEAAQKVRHAPSL